MILQAYTVLKAFGTENNNYCITKVQLDTDDGSQIITVVADHDSRNVACYWATMLNEGKYTEEQVREGIANGGHVG